MRTHPRWRLPDFTSTNGEKYPSSRNDRGKDPLLVETPRVGTQFLLDHDHRWVSAICLLFLFLLFFFFLLLLLYGIARNAQTSTTTQHEIVSFVCSIQNVGERRTEESLEMNMERLQPQLSYQPLFPTPRQVQWRLLLGSLFNSAPWPYVCYTCLFFSMNWLNHVLSNREGVLNRNLTLDTTPNRCQRVLLLVWPPTDVFWKELSDLKVSLCTNLSGKKPSRWTWAIQSFKELSLGAVHRWSLGIPHDELVEDPIFLDAENPIYNYKTIAPSKSCGTCFNGHKIFVQICATKVFTL